MMSHQLARIRAWGLLGLMVTVGGVFVLYGWASLNHKVPPNQWVGLRTEKTLSNPEAWFKGNRFAGQVSLISGLTVIAASIVGLLSVLRGKDPMLTALVVIFIDLLIMVAQSLIVLIFERYFL